MHVFVNGNAKLNTYGTLEIGEVPNADLMIKTIPKDINEM